MPLSGLFDIDPTKTDMRLLVYSHSFAPQIGGVETYAMALARGLANSHELWESEGIHITVGTKSVADGFDDSSLPFSVIRRPRFWSLAGLIYHADIVHIIGPCLQPMFMAWLLHKPFTIEQHGYQSACPNGLLFFEPTKTVCPGHFMAGRFKKCWECNRSAGILQSWRMWVLTYIRRWFCDRASANVAISHHVHQRLKLRNSRVIYYGISDTASATERTPASRPTRGICFAYAGRLVSEKGLETLIDAATLLRRTTSDFSLKFIGDGPERPILEKRVASQNLTSHVVFTGFLAGHKLRHTLENVTAIVMPSRWEETAGLSAIEQMMRGRLVICSDIGGLGEVVDGVGLKFPAGDAATLAKLMQQIIDEPEIAARLGCNARSRAVRLFALERMIKDYVALFSGVAHIRSRTKAVAEFE
jgi:glycosyltransferase involved in cell wall biosynthesis